MPDSSNGEQEPRSASIWLRQIQPTAILHVADVITFQTARTHLDGATKHWYASKDIIDWHGPSRRLFINHLFLRPVKPSCGKKCVKESNIPRSQSPFIFMKKFQCVWS